MATLHVRLYGAPACRRYQRFRERLLEAALTTVAQLVVEEINDVSSLARFNPLTLPRLEVNGRVVASRNVPTVAALRRIFETYND